jgi:hypothetical protein
MPSSFFQSSLLSRATEDESVPFAKVRDKQNKSEPAISQRVSSNVLSGLGYSSF